MRRRRIEVNTRARFAKIFFVVSCVAAFVVVASSCGGRERHAERLWRQALECVEKGDTPGAVERLQKLIDQYPDAEIAAKAREQIIVYRGLVNAVESYPTRRARELMVQIARAIEGFRRERGKPPATLLELVPGKLAEIPDDPWGHPFSYETAGRSYRLRCQDQPLLVVDGEFRAVPP
jgi:hypothetical protein